MVEKFGKKMLTKQYQIKLIFMNPKILILLNQMKEKI